MCRFDDPARYPPFSSFSPPLPQASQTSSPPPAPVHPLSTLSHKRFFPSPPASRPPQLLSRRLQQRIDTFCCQVGSDTGQQFSHLLCKSPLHDNDSLEDGHHGHEDGPGHFGCHGHHGHDEDGLIMMMMRSPLTSSSPISCLALKEVTAPPFGNPSCLQVKSV